MDVQHYLVAELNSIDFHPSGDYVEIRLVSYNDERVAIGMQPEMAHALVAHLTEERQKAANAGIFPTTDEPNQQYEILTTPHEKGVDITMDLGPHKTGLNFQITKDQARILGRRLLALADEPDNQGVKAH